MADFEFANCRDALLKCCGTIVGGVEKAECTRKNSLTEIKEFLNDTPVTKIVSTVWELKFEMRISDDTPFLKDDYFDTVELDLGKKKIVYKCCRILEFSSAAEGNGSVFAVVKLSADERVVV